MSIVQFNGFIPVYLIDYAAAIVVVMLAIGLSYRLRYWVKTLPARLFHEARTHIHFSGMVGIFFSELGQRVLIQRLVFRDSRSRWAIHLMVFWGFVGLAFATVWDDIFYRSGVLPAPFTLENFGNVVGNVAGALTLAGLVLIILRYTFVSEFKRSYKGDLTFLALLFLTTLTGFATEIARFSAANVADINYAVHLILVGLLLVTAPFTHFFHALLTPFMRYVGRVDDVLTSKGINSYPFYRKLQMARLADDIHSGKAVPTYPTWLKRRKEEG